MQDSLYKYIKNKYGDKAEMLLTGTSSLIYKIKTENVYEDFYIHKQFLDFSNYPEDSKSYNDANNLVVNKMKD